MKTTKSAEEAKTARKIYIVVETSWDGSRYSFDDATPFFSKEEAEKHDLDYSHGADTVNHIVEKEIDIPTQPKEQQ